MRTAARPVGKRGSEGGKSAASQARADVNNVAAVNCVARAGNPECFSPNILALPGERVADGYDSVRVDARHQHIIADDSARP